MPYSRSIFRQSEATDKVHAIVPTHPEEITVSRLMREHKLSSSNSILAAIDLLEKEEKVRVERSQGHEDFRDGIKVHRV